METTTAAADEEENIRVARHQHYHGIGEENKKGSTGRRIAKWLSDAGHCSRRAGERLVAGGRVFVNGEVCV